METIIDSQIYDYTLAIRLKSLDRPRIRKIILTKNSKVIINGIYYIFLGIYPRMEDVPNVTCIFIIDGIVYARTVVRPTVPRNVANRTIIVPETSSANDNKPIETEIRPDDDELMVIMKSLLKENGITVGIFKDMYGNENKTDMNNDKSRIENKNTLSFNKFKHLLSLMKYKYEIIVYRDENV